MTKQILRENPENLSVRAVKEAADTLRVLLKQYDWIENSIETEKWSAAEKAVDFYCRFEELVVKGYRLEGKA